MPTTTKKVDLLAKLNEPPPQEALKHRKQGSANLTYVEGWWVIAQANEIFDPRWVGTKVLWERAAGSLARRNGCEGPEALRRCHAL
jgi:hypothetical protein